MAISSSSSSLSSLEFSISSSSSKSSISSASSGSSSSSSSNSSSSSSSSGWVYFDYRGVIWTTTKPLNSEIAAIGNNRLSQSFRVPFDVLVINQISLYVGRAFSNPPASNYNLNIQVYEANTNGVPITPIGSPATISSTTIQSDGWVNVDYSINQTISASKMISIVAYQDGGNETDYIGWYYTPISAAESLAEPALFSSDSGSTWSVQPNISRSIKILNTPNIFDASQQQIETQPGTTANTLAVDGDIDKLKNGFFDRTIIKYGREYNSSDSSAHSSLDVPNVSINSKPLVASFVIDESGSMGWSDRSGQRSVVASDIVSQLMARYAPGVYVDVVNFGGDTIKLTNSITTSAGSGASAIPPILAELPASGALTTIGATDPQSGATLTALNSNHTVPDLTTDTILGIGFDGLLPNHTYIVSNITMGQSVLEDGNGVISQAADATVVGNWFSDNTNGTSPVSITMSLPGDVVQGIKFVTASNSHKVFKDLTSSRLLYNTRLVAAASEGDVEIYVDNATGFKPGASLDIYNESNMDAAVIINTVDTTVIHNNTITLASPIVYNFGVGSLVIQRVNVGGITVSSGYFSCSIMDVTAGYNGVTPIKFSIVTSNGGEIQIPIVPSTAYDISNIQLCYQTTPVEIQINGQDNYGNPLPNQTEVILAVGNNPLNIKPQPTPPSTVPITGATPIAGSTQIQINPADLGDAVVGSPISYVTFDGTVIQSASKITAINKSTGVITIFPPVSVDDNVAPIVGIKIEPISDDLGVGALLPVTVSAVEVTPMFAGREMDAGNRAHYDPPQIPSNLAMKDSVLNQWNQADAYRLDNAFDLPLFQTSADNTTSESVIRMLPVTGDNLNGAQAQQASTSALLNQNGLSVSDQARYQSQQSAYNDYLTTHPSATPPASVSSITPVLPTTPTGQSALENEIDALSVSESSTWTITTPIYLTNGSANGVFTDTEKTLSVYSGDLGPYGLGYFYGGLIVGSKTLLAAEYTVTPLIVIRDQYENIKTVQQLPSTNFLFASHYHIFSHIDSANYIYYGECCQAGNSSCDNVYVPDVMRIVGNQLRLTFLYGMTPSLWPAGI